MKLVKAYNSVSLVLRIVIALGGNALLKRGEAYVPAPAPPAEVPATQTAAAPAPAASDRLRS